MCAASSRGRQSGIPADVPLKADGTPDMRTRAAKEYVAQVARGAERGSAVPLWVPALKDGTVDFRSAVGRAFGAAVTAPVTSGCFFYIILFCSH